MRFTKLRLTGFKSFADPTEIVIADGLTGVVGPNGCGKSNLLEALRWVMGEGRASAMRGGGMEDVIFAGAATRPPRAFAEVVLQIDNADRRAPAAFNDADTLDITRRITRDAGSVYRIGDKDVRARDVQMLFADASTGARSPALVRQGQIGELINARPQARRRILEEAAGISGLYQRRHEADLKLRGAEANLARLDDVIGQLATQLATLSRQARQAVRYREIGTALRHAETLVLARRWVDADTAHAAARDALRARAAEADRAGTAARRADDAQRVCQDRLSEAREERAVADAVVQRLELRREAQAREEARARRAIDGLEDRTAQLARDIARERQLDDDAGRAIAALEAEEIALRSAADGHDTALAVAGAATREAEERLESCEADFGRATEDLARLTARVQSAEHALDESRAAVLRAEAQEAAARDEVARTKDALGAFDTALDEASAQERIARGRATEADAALQRADATRAAAQGEEARARAARSAADGEAAALRAEVAALARLVERDHSDGPSPLDRLRVAPGYERALGAALSDDLTVPLADPSAATGWVRLEGYDDAAPLPGDARSLSRIVEGAPELARRLSQTGLVHPADGPALQARLRPGQRLVSAQGDLWRWDGLRAGAADAPSAAALRLERMNRLTGLRTDLDRAEVVAAEAAAAHDGLASRLAVRTRAHDTARQARRDAESAATRAQRAATRAEADRDLASGRRTAATLARSRHASEGNAARTALREATDARAGLADPGAMQSAVDSLRTAVEAARVTLLRRRAAEGEIRAAGEDRAARLRRVTTDLAGWRARRATAGGRLEDLEHRQSRLETDLNVVRAAPRMLADERAVLSVELDEAGLRKSAAAAALSLAETAARTASAAAREADRTVSTAREARAGAEARAEAAHDGTEAAVTAIREARDVTPKALLSALEIAPGDIPAIGRLEAEIAAHRRRRDAVGAVNLRAEQDVAEVGTQHDRLSGERQDLEAAIAALRRGIGDLNRDGRTRLLAAFEVVNDRFGALFTHLFGGGAARLALVESDDPLEAGLEILCQPPGKKLQALSLLSGGEQTLTALALILAVFLANPAPICVLDEVDAPLDDANVARFCDLLDEMTRRTETRFLIITHHPVTMSRMDRLFGVTMAERGVSQLVSVDLRAAETIVA